MAKSRYTKQLEGHIANLKEDAEDAERIAENCREEQRKIDDMLADKETAATLHSISGRVAVRLNDISARTEVVMATLDISIIVRKLVKLFDCKIEELPPEISNLYFVADRAHWDSVARLRKVTNPSTSHRFSESLFIANKEKKDEN